MEIDLLINVSKISKASLSSSPDVAARDSPAAPPSLPEAILTTVFLTVITLTTIVGNVLVILSVFTYKPLRIAQNFFLISLAVADLTVAILVLPFNITQTLQRRWTFGVVLCQMWLTCDVLCCSASIYSLSAIALDRYWAIHDPINYAQKRTLKRVVCTIFLVWAISGVICLPPLIGWNDWSPPHDFDDQSTCRLTSQRGYVIYSSCGSFFIPLCVMTTVYVKIFLATRRRLHERTKTAMIALAQTNSDRFHRSAVVSCVDRSASNGDEPKEPVDAHSRGSTLKSEVSESAFKCDIETEALGPTMGTSKSSAAVHVEPDVEINGALDAKRDAARDVQAKRCALKTTDAESKRLQKADSKTSESCSPIHNFIEEKQKISLSKERRAARILGIVMGVFVVCWLPFFTMYVVLPFCDHCALSHRMENFITWLGYVNSALNPVIYTIFNIDFRRAFAKLLKCGS